MNVPAYVTVLQAATGLAVVLGVIVVLRRARERAAGQSRVPEAVGLTLLAWLGGTMALALAGVYPADVLPRSSGTRLACWILLWPLVSVRP